MDLYIKKRQEEQKKEESAALDRNWPKLVSGYKPYIDVKKKNLKLSKIINENNPNF